MIVIFRISPNNLQPWLPRLRKLLHDRSCRVSIVHRRDRYRDSQQQPSVSTAMFRFRPVIFLPPSYPRLPLRSLVLTLWLSMLAALGSISSLGASSIRIAPTSRSLIRSQRAIVTPSSEVIVDRAFGQEDREEACPTDIRYDIDRRWY